MLPLEKLPAGGEPCRTISVIVPVWRDHEALGTVISVLLGSGELVEVIVAFADADPAAMRLAAEMGAKTVDAGEPNRGRQLDLGAAHATGDWLLFHHADTTITAEHLRALVAMGDELEVIGGAFYRKFDERHPRLRSLEAVERWHNRTFGALYGDQSIFVRREVFAKLGGFRGLPLMEDVHLSLRLRRHGKIRLLDPPIASSPRKHLAQGPWRTTFANACLLLLYYLGVPPRRLHAFYYRRGASSQTDPAHSVGQPAEASRDLLDAAFPESITRS